LLLAGVWNNSPCGAYFRQHLVAARRLEKMERNMSGNTVIKLASAAALGATLLTTASSAMAAPLGIAPKATVEAPAQVTDVQWRRWGGGGYYRRGWGWGGPALGAAVGLGVLGAAAAAASTPYYYGYPAYGYPAYSSGYYAPSPYYYPY
jgi:hypothetical protein